MFTKFSLVNTAMCKIRGKAISIYKFSAPQILPFLQDPRFRITFPWMIFRALLELNIQSRWWIRSPINSRYDKRWLFILILVLLLDTGILLLFFSSVRNTMYKILKFVWKLKSFLCAIQSLEFFLWLKICDYKYVIS